MNSTVYIVVLDEGLVVDVEGVTDVEIAFAAATVGALVLDVEDACCCVY